MALARAAQPHPLRAVRRKPARRWMGGVPARAGRKREAAALGAGADGDPRIGAHSSAGSSLAEPHPCRGARRPRCAVGDGRGPKMRRSFMRDRRDLGRPQGARLHRDPAAGGCVGAQRHTLLAGAAWRHGEPQRRSDALAGRERAVIDQSTRSASTGASRLGRRAVPRTWIAAGAMERHP